MTNCDMVIWQANGKDSKVQDLWSTGRDTPKIDKRQDYVSTYTFNSTHVSFVSDRKLNTRDSQDFVIKNVRSFSLIFEIIEH